MPLRSLRAEVASAHLTIVVAFACWSNSPVCFHPRRTWSPVKGLSSPFAGNNHEVVGVDVAGGTPLPCAQRDAGDYRLVAANSPAEGAWTLQGGAPQWQDAPAGMVHLRVFPEDHGSLRFVPGLDVHAHFLDADGQRLGEASLKRWKHGARVSGVTRAPGIACRAQLEGHRAGAGWYQSTA